MRPGELDALRWDRIDFQAGTILIDQQWNAKIREFTPPKHGFVRTIALTDPARERLLTLPRESEFVFTTLRGTHYPPSSRSHHWNRVRCTAGLGNVDLYLATRHYFGWYAWNVLELPPACHRAALRPPGRRRARPQDRTGTPTRSSAASVSARRSGRRRRRRCRSSRPTALETRSCRPPNRLALQGICPFPLHRRGNHMVPAGPRVGLRTTPALVVAH